MLYGETPGASWTSSPVEQAHRAAQRKAKLRLDRREDPEEHRRAALEMWSAMAPGWERWRLARRDRDHVGPGAPVDALVEEQLSRTAGR